MKPSSFDWHVGRAQVRAMADGLRIALFSGNYNCVRDGANGALNRLSGHLLRQGHRVRIYSPTIAQAAFDPVGELVSAPSIPFPGRREYRLSTGLSPRLRADLARFAPDLVHVSAPDPLGFAAQRWARGQGLPIVASLHTRFESYAAHYGLGLLRRPIEALLARFYRGSDLVLAPTTAIQRQLATQLGGRVRLWARGVDPSAFSPSLRSERWRAEHGYAEDDVVLLFFGRLVREKGIEGFARTVAALRARGLVLRPLVVGDGPARSWFAERLPNAVFAGHLSGPALGRAIASADILLNPSLTEAFGNVTLEAMASGIVPVCADVPSARQLVRDGATGRLVRGDDVAGYADALEPLFADRIGREAMAGAAWAASFGWDWETVLDSVVAAYRELTGPVSAPAPRASAELARAA